MMMLDLQAIDQQRESTLLEELRLCRAALREARAESRQRREELLRARADYDNLRKRTERRVQQSHKFGNTRLLAALLPVKDNLELALAAAADAENDDGLREGLELSLQEFERVLSEFGVETIDPGGEPFDPELHEAVAMDPDSELPDNSVSQVRRKGYQLNGRLLRPAQVVVAGSP